jgi:hypothetical protein
MDDLRTEPIVTPSRSGSSSGDHRRLRRMGWAGLAAFETFAIVASLLAPAAAVAADPSAPTATETPAYTPSGPPTIASDKADFAPGETVTLTGTNWYAGELVTIATNDTYGSSWTRTVTVTASDTGVVTDSFSLPTWFVSNYNSVATGNDPARVATTTFTDLSIGTYDQCANDTGVGYPTSDSDPGCHWINGDLQHSNSQYSEGDATVQRLWLTGFTPGSGHSITLDYGTTKNGKHTYDFLTTWNWSENWITVDDRCQAIEGCGTADETYLDIPADPSVPDSFQPSRPATLVGGVTQNDGDRQFVMRGGTMTTATTPTIFSGSYADTSDTRLTVSFTVGPPSGAMCTTDNKSVTTCGVVLWFGAHVAAEANWGLGLGAGSVSGSPYHVGIPAIDSASSGTRDNQLQANTVTFIPNGTIVIVKDAVPNDAQDFRFNLSNNSTISQDFSLDDDSDTTLPNSQTFSVPPGAWTASELNLPMTGWDFTSLVCVDPTSNTTISGAVATINLASNETVTCTYTNTKRGTIIVNKTATGGDATFAYTTTGGSNFPAGFDITTSGGSGSQTYTNIVPGTYSVAETALAGWTLSSSSCSGAGNTPGSFTVPAGGTVTCSFANTRTYNQDLTVTKTATASFGRTYKWLIDKSVDKTQINIADGGTATFNYSVKVTPNGYIDATWAVAGKITVANSNAFAVSGVSVTDAIDNGGSCTVAGGTNVTVPANDNIVLDYSCKATYDTPNGSASGTAGVDFSTVTPSETNKTITVVDDKTDPANPVTLGTWNWADGEHTFTYSLDKRGVAGTCTDYTNTAKISETGQSDSQKVTVCVGKDLTVSKTAAGTFGRTYLWDIAKDVDQTEIHVAGNGNATFNYTVSVTQTGVTDAGWTLSGNIHITNPNDFEAITLTGLTDSVSNGGSCTVNPGPYVVPKSGSLDVGYSCSYASAPSSLSGTNTATATWDKTTASTPSGSASGSVGFTLTQSGSTNKTIHVTDPVGGGALGTVTATDPPATPASATFQYSRTVAGTPGTCKSYDNTATITETGQHADKTVTVCAGADLTVSKTASGTFDRTYLWSIAKNVDKSYAQIGAGGSYDFHYTVDANQTGVSDSGWTLSGTITIANPNDWQSVSVSSVSDVVDNGGTCSVTEALPVSVPASGSVTLNYTCSYASQPSSYSGTNTATANWDKAAASTPSGSASGNASFTLAQLGSTNKTIHVTDSYAGDLGTVTATDPPAAAASGEFTYTRTESGAAGDCSVYDNTATITETNQSASQEVTLCVGLDLTVSKTATPSFTRQYEWTITKNSDKTLVKMAAGQVVGFNYTVDVSHDSGTDSAWLVTGKSTVSNPNKWEAITATNLTDAIDNGGSCTVDTSGGLTIAAGGSVDYPYTCTYASAPAPANGTNTATATWDKATYATTTGSASGRTAANFVTPTTVIDSQVIVSDPQGGGLLGTANVSEPNPMEFGYGPIYRAGVAGTCTDYANTATFTTDTTGTTGSASKTVTVCVAKDLTVSKTAQTSFGRKFTWNITKDVDKTTVNIADGGTATFNYTVSVTHDGGTDGDWTASGKITVTNPNEWEDIVADVTDATNIGGDCTVTGGTGVTIPAGKSVTFDYSCTYSSAPTATTGTNTATATWDGAAYYTKQGLAFGLAPLDFTTPSGVIDGSVTVVDPMGGGTLGTASYTDSSPTTFTYSKTRAGVAGTCTDYNNTATFTTSDTSTTGSASQKVTVCVAKDLTVAKTAAGTFNRTYLWKISKDADKTLVDIADGGSYTFHYTVDVEQTGISDTGWTLSGKITLANPNDWEDVTLTALTDVVDNGGACTVAAGPYVVPKSGSLDVNYSCSYTSAPSSDSGTNTATATWDNAAYFTPTGSASGSAGFTLSQAGSTNKTVHVTDSYGGNLGTVTATDSAPFAKGTFTYTRTESGVAGTCTEYDNTATITETNQTASKTVTVCVAKDLTVSKTATPTFTRTFLWDITKAVDKTLVRQDSGNVTFNYTVVATETGFTDSAWKVVGTITVANPNDWEAITANVSDAVDNGGTCKVYDGATEVTSVTVPKSGSKSLTYTCTWTSKPSSYSGTNTVTATWDKAIYFTPTGSASGTAGFVFDAPAAGILTNVNKTVTVTDTFNGTTQTLGTVPAVTTTPYTTKTFTYSYTVPVPAASCKSYDNTAKIVETGQSASQTVTVCKPSLVTDTMLCSLANDQFRLVYTPDQTPANGWKLNASNPGQFYYNIFYTGNGNEDITVTLPYPWVTQGAVPIHFYSSVGVTTNGTTTCLTPGIELASSSMQVTLANYWSYRQPYDFSDSTTITIHVPAVSGGFAYVNIHLDYGLKGTTGYAKGGTNGNDAVKVGTSTVLIRDLQTYAFSDATGGAATIKSINAFKKDPGIGGLVQNSLTDPVKNAKVEIFQGTSTKPYATVYTDEDGWYMWQYKWTGKAATFIVKMTPPAPYGVQSQTVTLKANGYLVVSFTVK